ncbi:hypothetical protein F503_05188 [Ophiostoma piceae UAMH 11346]|uniref:Uncharacterized protein n=1 Tax=Ophiostoma piceae (strain UAMH 11346) TaxID=1262450 RepID=S3CTR2_OPHP1|nr:hypothetical protein F503_05188 [Ophiostoma piceae UAMH 11346]
MMAEIPSPDAISESAFSAALARYPAVIKAVSKAKSKPGQQTLEELDEFRYVSAPARFGLAGGETSREAMSLDDVKTLVAWKLKHGKFRPTLMKLVESNDKATVEKTVLEALSAYEAALPEAGKENQIQAHAHASTVAVRVLSRLRGIGPATASLLAAVHYPQKTIFFSDEAYAWLCGGSSSGYQRPSKYNDKEYAELTKAAAELMIRLDKSAQDVEQAAYVLINDDGSNKEKDEKNDKKDKKEKKETKDTAPKAKAHQESKSAKTKVEHTAKDNKRKEPPTDAAQTGSRRSSRLRSG